MEQKIIGLSKGIRRNPASSDDGELTECINLVVKNGEIRNAPELTDMNVEIPEGHRLVYIHQTTGGKYYILHNEDEGVLACIKENEELDSVTTICETNRVREATSTGNVLIVVCGDNMFYCLWSDGGYTLLGNHIPELTLAFNLKGELKRNAGHDWGLYGSTHIEYRTKPLFNDLSLSKGTILGFTSNYGIYPTPGSSFEWWDSKENTIYDALNAAMVESLGQETDRNRFTQPFFVRYALRLIDGTNTMPSAPILMIPSTGASPTAFWRDVVLKEHVSGTNIWYTLDCDNYTPHIGLQFVSAALQMKCTDVKGLAELKKWKDVVKGVDVFVSPPFYRYMEQAPRRFVTEDRIDMGKNAYPHIMVGLESDDYKGYFAEDMIRTRYVTDGVIRKWNWKDVHDIPNVKYLMPISHKSQKEQEESIKECNTFYHLKFVPIDDIPVTMSDIDIEEGVLKSLTGRRILTDEQLSHDTFIPQTSYVYNGRLSVGNIKRRLFDGFNPLSIFGYTNKISSVNPEYGTPSVVSSTVDMYCVVYVKKDGRNFKVESATAKVASNFLAEMPKFFYYPDPGATVVEMHVGEEVRCYKMKEHPGLFGSYYFSGLDVDISSDSNAEAPENVEEDNVLMMKNRILASKVNNPFVFDITEANDVGSGEILRIKSNVTALSQGQFGQHPIYAFCSDGVWALPVTEEGKLMPAQPLPREILLENADVCQMDATLAFPTVGGLKMISGSNIESVSKNLEGMTENVSAYTSVSERWSNIQDESLPFNILLEDCTMVHDAANSMLRVFSRKLDGVHYVLDLGSGEWSKAEGGIPDSVVAGYPYWVMQRGNRLYRYEGYNDSETKRQGVLVTREIAFDNPLALKMLHWVRLMRKKHEGTAKVAVYVSNDRENWIMLKSLRKRSWKWYRFAVFTDMTDMDAIEGIVCGTEERWTNRPR